MVDSLGFVHAKLCHLQTDNITSSFSIQVPFTSFSCLLARIFYYCVEEEWRNLTISSHSTLRGASFFIISTVILHSLMINLKSISKDNPWTLKFFSLLQSVANHLNCIFSFIEFFDSKMFDSFMDSVSLLNFSLISWKAFLIY